MRVWGFRDPKDQSKTLGSLDSQDRFAYSDSFITYMAGGWGAGKSHGLLKYIEVSTFANPGCPGILIEPDYKMLRDFVNNKLRPAAKHLIVDESKQDNTIFMERGIRIIYLSGHNLDKLEQYEAAWLVGDEVALMGADLLHRSVARVRDPKAGHPRIGYAGTPHYGWLKEEFAGRNNANRRIIHVRTLDNPFLTKEAIDSMLANVPASLQKAYIEGQFVPPGGQVYPELDRNVHVIPWNPDSRLKTVAVIDWAYRTPHVLIAQMLPKGYELRGKMLPNGGAVVVAELYPENIRTEDLCKRTKQLGYQIHEACADPAGEGKDASSGMDQIQIAKKILGVPIKYTNNARLRLIRNGIEHVGRALMPASGVPMLYFSEQVAEAKHGRAVVNAMEAYSYPQDKDGKPVSNEPIKDGIVDHACDCVRYLVINHFPVIRLQSRVRSIA